ncbi:type 1 periplasmic binding fold superfamily protein [Nonlabens agnitus]|uniref:Type 1 periplasmic binding fold superfamily protein n=1 Tax=Nonlabens agnitus TaxID=870484 RepID=A0A2S9WU84_9FLAO|nr:type 1 periplasmic binding fold superfamily protein [Nonlabens agnitus]PRP67038.1 type 1 periplasmic binding fold superfamily protein [Nonlabens agnitus]
MKTTFKFLPALLFAAVLISCEDDDSPVQINEDELITTVEYQLTNTADATNVVTFRQVDNDADGPNMPTVTITGTVLAGQTYTGNVRFLNELESPVENITEEVEEEGDEHEVFYGVNTAGVTINKIDNDADGNPLGLRTNVSTGSAGSGSLTITLIHEPVKPNTGLTSAGGEPDAIATFNFNVQ